MNGKQSGPDFKGEAEEFLWVWLFLRAGLPSSYDTAADQS